MDSKAYEGKLKVNPVKQTPTDKKAHLNIRYPLKKPPSRIPILLLYKQSIKKRLTDVGNPTNGANRFLIPKFMKQSAENDSVFVRRKKVNRLFFRSRPFKKKTLKCCDAVMVVSVNDF